jgi:membrane peptidoglycan carboxypeptidase
LRLGLCFVIGSVMTLKGRPVGAMNGTTNGGAYVDARTVWYTPSLVAGVWVGRSVTNQCAIARLG